MNTITQDRARLRAQLFKMGMLSLEDSGVSQERQMALMPQMLTKAYEIERSIDDADVLDYIAMGQKEYGL